ncbi:glycosyltransferase, putative [Ricinus communis]|uniref:Glycosyltransferase, putative n=1 Tax=Ricinus communis TaxID=3988 RepID=B9TFV9_RICCO|nr:glycosyltransferase, putative [Ricinus communis]|eukprot:XP_002537128.1 uncharacterized protein LOC8273994 [Ricinus communis]
MAAIQAKAEHLPPILFDLDDIEHVMLGRSIAAISSFRDRLFARLAIPTVIQAEQRSIRGAAWTFVCSEADRANLKQKIRAERVKVIPNSIPLPASPIPLARSLIILMVGVYSYGPNDDGANYFIEQIFPKILIREPKAELWLVGREAEKVSALKNAPSSVRALGFVEDIAAVYRAARVVICPIRYGSGTRVKLVEAAAWAKPIVSTTLGAEGLCMEDQQELLLADSPEDFADSCLKLLQDDNLCEKLGRNARRLAEQNFDEAMIIEKLSQTIITVAAQP